MISDIIFCGGTIEASPNHEAYVSVPINGYMKKILKHIGEYVKEGQVLAILEHPDYIDLQRDFLETKSQYTPAETAELFVIHPVLQRPIPPGA